MMRLTSAVLPASDEDYQGPSWWGFSRLLELRHSRGMRRIAFLGLLVEAAAIATGILNVTQDWNGIPVRIGPVDLSITLYPPFVLSLLSAIWIGPTWGLVPAYSANFVGALVSGLPPISAALFALSGAVEILIFWGALVMLNVSPELRRRRDVARFALASVMAAVTASLGIVIWNAEKHLGLGQSHRVWSGWVIGDVLQSMLVVAPLLRFAGAPARGWIDRQFAFPPRSEVPYTRTALLAVLSFGMIAALVFFGIYTLEGSLEIDPTTRTGSGELLLPRLRQMETLLGIMVAALTVATAVYTHVLARLGERQRRLSRRESLTGAFNRRAFYELFPREAERARRLGHGVSLVFLDLDHFKRINDRLGHETGDRVLQQFASRIRGLIRETDLLFRWGGEEFVVLQAHTDPDEAPALAERIRAAVASRPFAATDSAPVAVTVSAGVAGSSEWPIDADVLVARADAACYTAKDRGRNRVEVAPSST